MRLAAFGAAVFGAVLVLTFPTEPLVRHALDRLGPPGALTFTRARLRPWGVRLDGVVLHRPDGSPVVSAEWVTLRPSLAGLLSDRTGRPWHAAAAACSGLIEAVFDRDGTGNVLGLTWTDVDLARCPLLAAPGETLTGLAAGDARLRSVASGEGRLALRAASWSGARPMAGGAQLLHADTAEATWRLEGRELALGAVAFRGPELDVRGSGTVRLADTLAHSALDLVLTVAASPGAPPDVAELIGRLPPRPDATRRVSVTGTVGLPLVVGAP